MPRLPDIDLRSALLGAALMLLLLLLIGAFALSCPRHFNHYLGGLWVGEPDWLARAGLSDARLYISPGPRRSGYLILVNTQGDFIANAALEVDARFRRGSALRDRLRGCSRDSDRCEGVVCLRGEGLDKILPGEMRAELSRGDGTLALRDDAKLWGLFTKDFAGTADAHAAWKARAASAEAA